MDRYIKDARRTTMLWLLFGAILIHGVSSFLPPSVGSLQLSTRISFARRALPSAVDQEKTAKIGDLLGKLPTPSFLVELSLIEKYLHENGIGGGSVDDFLANPQQMLSEAEVEALRDCGAFFIHTQVTSTEKRDAVLQTEGSGKSLPVCSVDTPYSLVAPAGAYLGLGLANHHVGGYYWARSMGIGASLPAHGIYFGPASSSSSTTTKDGELFWKKRGPGDPSETTEESSNSNDGKRSEWADFLKVGDTVQLVPYDPLAILRVSPNDDDDSGESQPPTFNTLLGIRRAGRPLGADPIVENIWIRAENDEEDGWRQP